MIYSRWRPETGVYDYYEVAGGIPLGNDLPTPRLSAGTSIGVASVDIGRKMPMSGRHVGSGSTPRGMITPVSATSGLGALAFSIGFGEIAMVAAGAALGWWLRGRVK